MSRDGCNATPARVSVLRGSSSNNFTVFVDVRFNESNLASGCAELEAYFPRQHNITALSHILFHLHGMQAMDTLCPET